MLLTIPPEEKPREFTHILTDYNGVLARDGLLLEEARKGLIEAGRLFSVHVATADTFGTVRDQLEGLPVALQVIPGNVSQDRSKFDILSSLGPEHTIAIGNGRNDALMLKYAGLGICVVGLEGAAVAALLNAQVVVNSIEDAFGLLLNPFRLKATLRN
jgi:soluble P-type ATPase